MNWELVIEFIAAVFFGVLVGFWLCWKTEVKPRVKLIVHYKERSRQFHNFVDFHHLHLLWLRFTA
jgi:hypothetical protein